MELWKIYKNGDVIITQGYDCEDKRDDYKGQGECRTSMPYLPDIWNTTWKLATGGQQPPGTIATSNGFNLKCD